mmetsp:Transcript_50278/g.89769  ORF Transcript_50278/g.89769 Transcript_50278/m.89769 type:complete len:219 (+) Transcript_50278:528-1184(+)
MGSAESPTQRANTSPTAVSIQMLRLLSATSSSSTSPIMGSSSKSSVTSAATGRSCTLRALVAYPRVFIEMPASLVAGVTHASMYVVALPLRELCISRVRAESRHGTCREPPSARALITRVRTCRPKLILTPALSTAPAWARSMSSEPARSTSVSRASCDLKARGLDSPTSRQRCSTAKMSSACDREEWAWTPVEAVARALAPSATTASSWSTDFTTRS